MNQKFIYKIILWLTVILSMATGLFKVLQQPQDIELFKKIGLTQTGTTIIGVFQLLGGIAMIIPGFRKWGALIMILTFAVASAAVFASGMTVFGIVSVLFIAMAACIYIQSKKIKTNEKEPGSI